MAADRNAVRLATIDLLDTVTSRPIVRAWLTTNQINLVNATKQLVAADDSVVDKLAALLPADFKQEQLPSP